MEKMRITFPHNSNLVKIRIKNQNSMPIPTYIYTTYLITIVYDGKRQELPLKKQILLCGAVG